MFRACFLLCVVGFSSPPSYAQNPTSSPSEDADVLVVGVQQWLSQVSVCCTYTLTIGQVNSVEDALAGRLSNSKIYCTGIFNKRGSSVRVSKHFPDGPRDVSEARDGKLLVDVDHDEMTTKALEVNFMPPHCAAPRGVGKYLVVDEKPPSRRERMIAGETTLGLCDPLMLCGARHGSPLKFAPADPTLNITVDKSKVDGIEVTLNHKGQLWSETRSVLFKTDGNLPVVKKVVVKQRNASGGGPSFYVEGFDFVRCGDEFVPSTVRCVTASGAAPWAAYEWKSKDLGKRRCTDEDFVYVIAADVRIRGLKRQPPAKDGVRRIAVETLTPDDLDRAYQTPLAEPPGRMWLLVIGSGFMIACIVFYLLRRRQAGIR